MISKIIFDDILIIEKEEAERLNLEYVEIPKNKLGFKDNKLCMLDSYDKIKDVDVFLHEDGDWKTIDGVSKSSYYLYEKPMEYTLNKDWVKVEKEQMVDLLIFLPICKYPFRIIKTVIDSSSPNVLPIILAELNKKLLDTISSIEVLKETSFNSKCEVHMGGGLLLTINELKLIEDSCTGALQSELDNGWRIVSVNVQPNQRRSDYVLGRYNPEKRS